MSSWTIFAILTRGCAKNTQKLQRIGGCHYRTALGPSVGGLAAGVGWLALSTGQHGCKKRATSSGRIPVTSQGSSARHRPPICTGLSWPWLAGGHSGGVFGVPWAALDEGRTISPSNPTHTPYSTAFRMACCLYRLEEAQCLLPQSPTPAIQSQR
jgi:hypothetical protein